MDRIHHAQNRIQPALGADDLVDHQGLNHRAGIGQPRGFDDDPVQTGLFGEQGPERPDQISPDNAADAPAAQLN